MSQKTAAGEMSISSALSFNYICFHGPRFVKIYKTEIIIPVENVMTVLVYIKNLNEGIYLAYDVVCGLYNNTLYIIFLKIELHYVYMKENKDKGNLSASSFRIGKKI